MSPEEVLINRYLYYVYDHTLLLDHEYDKIERSAREVLPETSVVHGIGSSNASDYSASIIREAKKRVRARKEEIRAYQEYLADQTKRKK